MKSQLCLALALSAAAAAPARAKDVILSVETGFGSLAAGQLGPGDTLIINGGLPRPSNTVNLSIYFTPTIGGPFSMRAAWAVMDFVRMTGVNIDLFAGNTFLVSDAALGPVGNFATSGIGINLTAGQQYRIVLTGTHTGAGAFTIAVEPKPQP
ncbi:hypothetical protein [Hansschlegelia sp. KR7-227]|uniref:hypothetical protein n=1 Tax=Hansschlegelia sp. KR7-227 TaxID=3400914 RepID=UPI003C032780